MDETTVATAQSVASTLGLGGLGLLAAIMAIYLAMQMLARTKRNGTQQGGCGLALGTRTADDLYEVLIRMESGIDHLNENQRTLSGDNRELVRVMGDLSNSVARMGPRHG